MAKIEHRGERNVAELGDVSQGSIVLWDDAYYLVTDQETLVDLETGVIEDPERATEVILISGSINLSNED